MSSSADGPVIAAAGGVVWRPVAGAGEDGGIEVACGEGSLLLTRVVPEGKAPMSAADYIRGRRLSVGERLG